MQLRLQPRNSRNTATRNIIIKIILAALLFMLTIFLLDKIDTSEPKKLIKQEISNDKIITLK